MSWALLYVYFVLSGLASGLAIEPSAEQELLYRAAYLFAIVGWFDAYSRRHRLMLPMDMGLFLYFATFIVVPYYVIHAEGWRKGLRTLGWFLVAAGLSVALHLGLSAWAGGDG